MCLPHVQATQWVDGANVLHGDARSKQKGRSSSAEDVEKVERVLLSNPNPSLSQRSAKNWHLLPVFLESLAPDFWG